MENPEETGPEESHLPDGVEADLKAKHGPVVVIKVDGLGALAFHRMSQAVNDRLHVAAEDSAQKMPAVRQAVLSCLCHPVDDKGDPDYNACRALFDAS